MLIQWGPKCARRLICVSFFFYTEDFDDCETVDDVFSFFLKVWDLESGYLLPHKACIALN